MLMANTLAAIALMLRTRCSTLSTKSLVHDTGLMMRWNGSEDRLRMTPRCLIRDGSKSRWSPRNGSTMCTVPRGNDTGMGNDTATSGVLSRPRRARDGPAAPVPRLSTSVRCSTN